MPMNLSFDIIYGTEYYLENYIISVTVIDKCLTIREFTL